MRGFCAVVASSKQPRSVGMSSVSLCWPVQPSWPDPWRLVGFGLDSLNEMGASTVVYWELVGSDPQRQHRAMRLIGIAFVGLALYLAIESTRVSISFQT
jgi:hypothetical protein